MEIAAEDCLGRWIHSEHYSVASNDPDNNNAASFPLNIAIMIDRSVISIIKKEGAKIICLMMFNHH